MKILPFYTATAMRDAERVNNYDALLCPPYKALPFQIQREHEADTYLTSISIFDCDDNETDVFNHFLGEKFLITSWTNGAGPFDFETFDDSGTTILTAIESGAATAFCYSDEFTLATGESIAVVYDLTLRTGTLPRIALGNSTAALYSRIQSTVAGGDTVLLTATGNDSGSLRLLMSTTVDTSFASTFSEVHMATVIRDEFTTYDFITYNGNPLSTVLSYGVYYLKISDGNADWFSEWFAIENIQEQILTGYTEESYDTFTTTGPEINACIKIAAASASCYTNEFTVRAGEIFTFTYDLYLYSGSRPFASLYVGLGVDSNVNILQNGPNEAEFVVTSSGSARLRIATTLASNFQLLTMSLRRKSGEYVHLEYTNARDFNNTDESIYYAGGWTQQVYLRTYLNLPSHESIEIGSDKNGEFEAEKLVRKYTRSTVSYESRAMYNALTLLKNHSTIKILDEVGVEYTPKAGNVDVNMDWNTFDTGTLRILWNEIGNVWTNNMDNIV